jgi:hypothetical protein
MRSEIFPPPLKYSDVKPLYKNDDKEYIPVID